MKRTLVDWAPVIGAAAATGLFCAYYLLIDMRIGSLADVTREQGKILWGSSSFVLNLAMIWSSTVCVLAIHQLSNSFTRRQRSVIFVAFGLLYLLLTYLVYRSGGVAGRAAGTLLENIQTGEAKNVFAIIDVNNGVAVLVAILLALALVFVTRGAGEASVRSLADRIHWFNLLLYSGGVVLATAVYEIYQLFQWGASLDLQRESLQALASSIAVGAGLVFSSLLVLIVVPPAIRLNRRLHILMSEAVGSASDFEPEKWLLKEGIESTPLSSLSAYVAVLLPAATGLMTKLPGWGSL